MSQQPNINDSNYKLQTLSDLPVPRSQGEQNSSSTLKHPYEVVFSIPSPDSGYALKLIKKYEHLWSSHHKKKLISKIISNLVIYQASLVGRGPTKSDIEKVYELMYLLVDAKQMIIDKMNEAGSIGTFVRTRNGFKTTSQEGYVAIDKMSGGAVKLVDRMEFSRMNFNDDVIKGWQK